ncbi:PspC domain-containing protein [Streptomyces gamaensis]|uniref:PspC domain-containing protein n=1 Tax=Streptomyces gamaensis TaxID=1763542 RepID=A0ABW0Z4Z0_9ACTN
MSNTPTSEDARRTDAVHGDPPAARPPLRRSREHKVVGGVCGGLGRCFDLDPVIFRVVLGVLAVAGGLGLIVYGFAWLLIPLEGEDESEGRRLLSGRVEGPALTAVLCALVGCGLFLSMLNNGAVMSFALMLTIATAGAAYWSQYRRRPEGQEDAAVQKTMEAPPETQAPPAPGTPSWWRDPLVRPGAAGTPGTGAAHTGYLWGPDDSPAPAGPEAPAATAGAPAGAPRADRAAARPPAGRPAAGRPLGGWTFLAALLALALGVGLTWHHHPLGTSLEIGLACALGVFGLGMVVSSCYGRTGGGTVVAAVLTAALLTGAAALPKSVTADWTRATWHPTTTAAVQSEYRIGSGTGVLDLTGLALPEGGGGGTVRTSAEVGAGQLTLVVPANATARLSIDLGIGDVRLPGEARDQVDLRPGQKKQLTLEPRAGQPSHGTLDVRLKVGIGQVQVTYATP